MRNKVLSERQDEYEALKVKIERADEVILRAEKEREEQMEVAQESVRAQAMAEQRAKKMSELVD